MALTLLDVLSELLTVLAALAVSALALGTLAVGRRLLRDVSVRGTLRRAAAVSLRDPNVTFDRYADRNQQTKEILVSFGQYRLATSWLFRGVAAALVLLVLKLLVVLLRSWSVLRGA